MSYWKTKVLPRLKKYFDKPAKRRGAAEACKSFETSKEAIEKEFAERRDELKPKAIQIFKSSDADTEVIVKKPTDEAVKKHPQLVQKLLEELAKADFPGARQVSDAAAKYGPSPLLVPVIFVLQKVSALVVEQEDPVEIVATESHEKAQTLVVPQGKEVGEETVTSVVVDENSGQEAVVQKVERVEETTTEDGKTVATVEVSKTVVVTE